MNSFRSLILLSCSALVFACSPGRQGVDPIISGHADAGPRDGGSGGGCTKSEDCQANGAAVCDIANHACVQCLTDGQCPTTETCKHDMVCHGTVTCHKDDDCSSAFECGSEGTCVVTPGRCMASNDCLDPAKKACDTESLTCVACLTSLDCGSNGVAQCTSSHTCQLNEGRCRRNSDCSGSSNKFCDTETNFCVPCLANADCPSNQCNDHSCAPLGTCVDDASCVNVSGKPKCETESRRCVLCLSNNDCPDNGTCTSNNTCRAAGSCSSDNDCSGVQGRPRCGPSNQCVACVGSSDCGGRVCAQNQCQAADYCTSNTNCTALETTPYCNTSAHKCVACLQTNQCSSGEACISNVCQFSCSIDGDCQDFSHPYCLTSNGTCVECTSSSQCFSGETCSANTCHATSTGTSCQEIITCENACTTSSCITSCVNAGSPTAQSLLADLVSCLFDGACPDTGTTGVCNASAAGYNSANCSSCLQTAQTSGGACYTELVACQND